MRSLVTMTGPFSLKRPNKEEPPGPPCNHRQRGSVDGEACNYNKTDSHTMVFILKMNQMEETVNDEKLNCNNRAFIINVFLNNGIQDIHQKTIFFICIVLIGVGDEVIWVTL